MGNLCSCGCTKTDQHPSSAELMAMHSFHCNDTEGGALNVDGVQTTTPDEHQCGPQCQASMYCDNELWKEVQHVKTVLKRGTSAERQIKCFEAAKAKGMSDEDALKAVVDALLKETLEAT